MHLKATPAPSPRLHLPAAQGYTSSTPKVRLHLQPRGYHNPRRGSPVTFKELSLLTLEGFAHNVQRGIPLD